MQHEGRSECHGDVHQAPRTRKASASHIDLATRNLTLTARSSKGGGASTMLYEASGRGVSPGGMERGGMEHGKVKRGNRDGSLCSSPDQVYTWLSAALLHEGVRSWGEVLDAGTGISSICWIVRHQLTRVDAVTAASSGSFSQQTVQRAARGANVRVLLANWKDDSLLAGRTYDVVVADYLIGAVEMFWRYAQDAMLSRLLKLIKPGGHLLFIGLEPYDQIFSPMHTVSQLEALGDAAALLGGSPSYREMPQAWVERQLAQAPGIKILSSRQFPSTLGPSYARSQLAFASQQSAVLSDTKLRAAFLGRVAAMQAETTHFSARGRNYAIVARRDNISENVLVKT